MAWVSSRARAGRSGSSPATSSAALSGRANAPDPGSARVCEAITIAAAVGDRSGVVDLDRLDDHLHRRLDDRGVRMADNDVAVALVAVRARGARRRQARLDDVAADQLLGPVDADHAEDAAAADA